MSRAGDRSRVNLIPSENLDRAGMSRNWTINGQFLTQNVTGVQRYAREILRALDAHLNEGHPLARGLRLELLVPQSNTSIPPLKCITVRKAGAALSGHLWEQIALPLRARNGILSLCNTSTVFSRKQIVCIHDLNTLAYPRAIPLRSVCCTALSFRGS